MPTRLMDSAPPPIVISCWPDMICAAAKFTASRPEAQKRADLDARHRFAETGIHCGEAGDVAAGLTDRIDHAQDHVVDGVDLDVVALLKRLQRRRRQRQRRDLVQGAVGFALAARRADMIVDKCLRHDALLRIPVVDEFA